MMTRSEHLKWAKHRALEYYEAGLYDQAITSIMSDLRKHPDTENLDRLMSAHALGVLSSGDRLKVRDFIEGFGA